MLDEYVPNETFYLDEVTRKHLHRIGDTGEAEAPAGTHGRHMLDRLLIDLSWSSSKLEGNTYSLLDTEALIQEGREAKGKNANEAQMILNHKVALEFIIEEIKETQFNRRTFTTLHYLLSDNLMPNQDDCGRLRTGIITIGGSKYHPTAMPQLIEEMFDMILAKADQIKDPFEQSFFLLVHIPYLQAFQDVNKRTSRLSANISLIKNNLCPLTFVDMPKQAYIEGILGIYEMNRIELLSFRDHSL
jgi:Fic family protein